MTVSRVGKLVAAVNQQRAVVADRHEHARPGNLGRIVLDGALIEGGQRRLDLAEPLVHRVGQLVRILILGDETIVLLGERRNRRLLLGGQVDRRAGERAQPGSDAVGQAYRRLDPLPAFARNLVRD